MSIIELNDRQERIIEIVKNSQPITSEDIASKLKLTRSTLRPDLALLTMSGVLEARPRVGYFYNGKASLNLFSDRIKKIKVSDIKSVPVVVDEETTVYDAIVTLFLEDTGTIYVISNGFLAGVVSRKDFLQSAIGGTDISRIPVGVIMTRMPNITVAKADENVLDVAIKIIEHEVDSVPIVEEVEKNDGNIGYKVIGRVSKTNITRLFVDLCKAE